MSFSIVLDIGGSHIAAGLVDIKKGNEVVNFFQQPLNKNVSAEQFVGKILDSILAISKNLRSFKEVNGIGISMPGPFDYAKGVCKIEGVNKFDSIFGLDVKNSLISRLAEKGILVDQITFLNDAKAFLLGILHHNNNQAEKVLAITIGTGVGSASYSDGELFSGFMNNDYLYNSTFKDGRAEDYFSTQWFLDQAKREGVENGETLAGVKELSGIAEENYAARKIFKQFGKNLAEYLNQLTSYQKTDRIVFGGKIFRSFDLFKDSFGQHFKNETEIQIVDKTAEYSLVGAAVDLLNREELAETDIRKTYSPVFPVHKKRRKPDGYDIYPAFPVGKGKVKNGYKSLAEFVCKTDSDTVVMDGNIGTNWQEIVSEINRECISKGLYVSWYCIDAAAKSAGKTAVMLEDYLGGDDPLFGYQYPGLLENFFEKKLLQQIQPDKKTKTIIYGTGAALADWSGPLIYFDQPKKEIQSRSKAGSVTNLGMTEPRDPGSMYKQFYFIDWPVCNKHKKALLPKIDAIADGQRPGTITWMSGHEFRKGLGQIVKSPFRVRPVFAPGVWGGQWMKERFEGLNKKAENYAWSYEIIAPENGIIFESDGVMLEAGFEFMLYHDNKAVLGRHADEYGDYFPLRFNHLDTMDGQNLSLQCHPVTDYIRENFGEHITQDETYYVMDTRPESIIYFGFREDIDADAFKAEFSKCIKSGKKVDVEKYVQTFPAKKHDLYLIPAGTIHSSGKNNVVLEISNTPYIFTFKIYDWQRLDLNGKPRPLNTDRAFENLDFERKGDIIEKEYISKPVVEKKGDGWRILNLPTHKKHLYSVQRLEFEQSVNIETDDRFQILNLVEGESVRIITEDKTFKLNYAETIIIPAAAENIRIENDSAKIAKVVKAFMK